MSSTWFERVPIGDVGAYWDRRPCNIRHSREPVGTRRYFDEVEARKYRVEPHIPAFAAFPRWSGKWVLEIGCGIGTDTINFAREQAQVTAVDLSAASLEVARSRAEVYGLCDRIEFYQANAEELSRHIPLRQYDLVYSFGVIHHTPHPGRVLQEARRFLAPGGTLKLMVYHRRSWKVLAILATSGRGEFWRLPLHVARHSEAETGCPVTYTYNRRELTELLHACDFRTREMAVDHVFPYRIADYVQHRYVREWYFRWMPPSVFRAMERRLGWHLLATAEAV